MLNRCLRYYQHELQHLKINSSDAELPVLLYRLFSGCPISSLDYASPLLDMIGDSKKDIEGAIAMASVCWNIGTYPEKLSHEFEDGFISNMLDDLTPPEELEEVLFLFLSIMIEGRRTIFSEDPRYVMDYEVLWAGDEYCLRVFSSMVPPEMFEDVTKKSFEEVKADLIEKQEIKI